MTLLRVFLLFSLHTLLASANDLKDVTRLVFGKEGNSFLPAAFGDFNSDKLTDMIALTEDRKSVAVLLASEQNVVSIESSPMFESKMSCPCPGGKDLHILIAITFQILHL